MVDPHDPRINYAPPDMNPAKDLPPGLLEFVLPLHSKYTPWQRELVAKREQVLQAAHRGDLPNHPPSSDATIKDWRIELPAWCSDQRNQMTGPADDGELTIKLLNSGSPGVMLDVEDSMANLWPNLMDGIQNMLSAVKGELTYFDTKRNQTVGIKDPKGKTVIWLRPRGLHLNQGGIVKDELMSASLFDVAMLAFQVEPAQLKHPLAFYIPKSESAEEALWWRDLFQDIARARGWAPDYIKAMALVESHPLAYQMEEFLYNLREHLLGLNLGRWDYMASLIHFTLHDPDWVLPNRNTIPSNVPFFQNVRELMVEICHKHGAMAIGGMTALYPSRQDPELNARALAVLEKDKQNEAEVGMDGAWTGHPDQNEIAVSAFPEPNQLDRRYPKLSRHLDLRPSPKGVGELSVAGTRAAVRTVIRYRNGVLNGKGASLLDGYMEDLATDRIYRLMVAQRMRHSNVVSVVDERGKPVRHTPEFIHQLFDQELERILHELPAETPEDARNKYREARRISEEMITRGQFNPV